MADFNWDQLVSGIPAGPRHLPRVDEQATFEELAKVTTEHLYKTDITTGITECYGVVMRDDTDLGHCADLTSYDADGDCQKLRVRILHPPNIQSEAHNPISPDDHHAINKLEPLFVAARGAGAPPKAEVGDRVIVQITEVSSKNGGTYRQNLDRGTGVSTRSRVFRSTSSRKSRSAKKSSKTSTKACFRTPEPFEMRRAKIARLPKNKFYPIQGGKNNIALIGDPARVKGEFANTMAEYLSYSGYEIETHEAGSPEGFPDSRFAIRELPSSGLSGMVRGKDIVIFMLNPAMDDPIMNKRDIYDALDGIIVKTKADANSGVKILFLSPIINRDATSKSITSTITNPGIRARYRAGLTDVMQIHFNSGQYGMNSPDDHGVDYYNIVDGNKAILGPSSEATVPFISDETLTSDQAVELLVAMLNEISGAKTGTKDFMTVPAITGPALVPDVAFEGVSREDLVSELESENFKVLSGEETARVSQETPGLYAATPFGDPNDGDAYLPGVQGSWFQTGGEAYAAAMASDKLKGAFNKNCKKKRTKTMPASRARSGAMGSVERLDDDEKISATRELADKTGIDAAILWGIMGVESAGTPNAIASNPRILYGINSSGIRITKVKSLENTNFYREKMKELVGTPVEKRGKAGKSCIEEHKYNNCYGLVYEKLDAYQAVRITAWGLFQIMGSNILPKSASKYEPNGDAIEKAQQWIDGFKANPRDKSIEAAVAWWSRRPKAKRAARERRYKDLVRMYYGGFKESYYRNMLKGIKEYNEKYE